MTILSKLIWLPILSALIVYIVGLKRENYAKIIALLVSVFSLLKSFVVYANFENIEPFYQLVARSTWLPALNLEYYIGVDGLSLPLVMLTCLFSPLVMITSWNQIQDRAGQFYACLLLLQGSMCGVFLAVDSILFYMFFEAMLIPMFLIIGIWGGPNRVYASIKFFLYTFIGSVFLLVCLIYLGIQAQSFSIPALQALELDLSVQTYIFFAMMFAFAVKIPMWPVHTWLPDAHVEAPAAGSAILAAIMLKIGGYGLFRFVLTMTPLACAAYGYIIVALSLVAIVYIGFVALSQKDMKKLVAYSSIAHMGFVTLGVFLSFKAGPMSVTDLMALEGAYMQMISHGFISGAMFICIGILYDRMRSRNITDYKGVANSMPVFATLFLFFCMANAGLPGTSGFVGEFLVILAALNYNFFVALAASTTLILAAAYTLWLYKRVMFSKPDAKVAKFKDMAWHETLVLVTLMLLVLTFGLMPNILFKITHTNFLSLLGLAHSL